MPPTSALSRVVRTLSLALTLATVFVASASAQNLGTPRVRYDIRGNLLQTGNTAMSCQTGATRTQGGNTITCANARSNRSLNEIDNDWSMVRIDEDQNNGVAGASATTQSTGASLTVPNTGLVRWAGLYWSCISNSATRNQVKLQVPGSGAYTTVTADAVLTRGSGNEYMGFKNVTANVQAGGTGNYWVADMQCNTGTNTWGGWDLVVIYEDATESLRDLVVWDGFQTYDATPVSLTLNGFITPVNPATPVVTDVGIFHLDGDLGNTDTLRLISGASNTLLADGFNTPNDIGNSSMTMPYAVSTFPNYANRLGYDLDTIRTTDKLPHNAQTATITATGSNNDVLYIGVVTFSTNIYAPDLVSTKNAVDLNGGQLLPGDLLEYTIDVSNAGLDAATNTVLTDVLPALTTLDTAADAVRLDGTTVSRSSAYNAGTNTVTISLGRMAPSDTHQIKIRVKLASSIPNGTILSNQASFKYNGETLGNSVNYTGLTDGSTSAGGSNPTDTPVTSPPVLTFTETAARTVDVDGQNDWDPGDTVTYTITISNSGGATTNSVVLTSAIDPALLQLQSLTTSAGTVASTTPGSLQVNVGNLAVGQSVTVTLVAKITQPFPVGTTSISNQWSAAGGFGSGLLSDDPSVAGAANPTVIQPIQAGCECFVGNTCYASGALGAGGCTSCQPAISQTALSPVTDGLTCGGTGTCHSGSCCTTCWDGSACVAGPISCGTLCGDGQRIASESCDDGNNADGDGCSSTCTVESGSACSGTMPSSCAGVVVILVPVQGSSTSDTTPLIGGSAPPLSTVTITEGGTTLCTTTASVAGVYNCDASTLTVGSHTIVANSSGPGLGDQGLSAPRTFDVILPCGDSLVGVGEACDDGNTASGDGCSSTCAVEAGSSCSGVPSVCTANVTITAPAQGSSTSDTTPTITGTAPAGSTVTVREGGTTLCTATASAGGTFTCDASALSLGGHTIVATTSGPGANDSGLSQPRAFTVIAPCGDGTIGSGEVCDDGNTASGDGCSSACAVEPGSSCSGVPSVCTSNVTITAPANGSSTSDTTPTITGTAPADSTVTVREGGATICTATADASGAYTCDASALPLGSHTFVATTAGPGANDAGLSAPTTFTIILPCGDGTIASGEACDDGNVASGDGCSSTCAVEPGYTCTGVTPSTCASGTIAITAPANGSQTVDTTPDVVGTAPAGSTVTVREGAMVLCITTADGSGAWTCTSAVLALGHHAIVASSSGPAAGDSGLSTSTGFTIVSAPTQVVPVILSPADGGTVSSHTPVVLGSGEPGASITVLEGGTTICTATVDPSGTWSCTPSAPLASGPHTLSAQQTKTGSTLGSTPVTFTVDEAALQSPALVAPAPGSHVSDPTPTLSGTAAPGSTVTVSENGSPVCTATTNAAGSWSCNVTTPWTEGPHVLDLGASLGGLTSTGGPDTITLDLTAPVVDVVLPANGTSVADTTPTIQGTTEAYARVDVYEGATLLCSVTADLAGVWVCIPANPMAEGLHSIRAIATDVAGNVSAPDATSFTIDTTGPAAPVITGPSEGATLSSPTPTIVGTSEPGATITVTEGGSTICTATADAAGVWSCVPTAPLADGPHVITATASDPLGNVGGSDTQSFTIDPSALSTPTLTGPLTPTGDATPDLVGLADPGSTVTVRDGNGDLVCTALTDGAGVWTCTPTNDLAEGPNALTLTATDGPLTSAPGAATVVIDTTAPGAPTITGPGTAPIATTTPVIEGTSEPGTTVTVTGPSGPICTALTDASGHWACVPTTPLPEGPTPITAIATDGAGNPSPAATATVTVDTTAPTITIATPADGSTTDDTTPTVSGTTEPGAKVVVTDGNGFLVCMTTADATGAWSCDVPPSLVEGPHTLYATATDAAGNVSRRATTVFVVDTTVPPPVDEPGGLSGGALCAVRPGANEPIAFAVVALALAVALTRRSQKPARKSR